MCVCYIKSNYLLETVKSVFFYLAQRTFFYLMYLNIIMYRTVFTCKTFVESSDKYGTGKTVDYI